MDAQRANQAPITDEMIASMTLEQYLAALSERGSWIVADPAFWREQGITTATALAESLDCSLASDLHKDDYGFRPRGWTVDQARAYLRSRARKEAA